MPSTTASSGVARFDAPRSKRVRTPSLSLLHRDGPLAAAAADLQKTIHELEVHRAELEMQNEELRRGQVELERARQHLALLYDVAPVGYLTVDRAGVIHEANLTAARLLGRPRERLTGQELFRFVASESQDALHFFSRRLAAGDGNGSVELQFRRSDRSTFAGWVECHPEPPAPGQRSRFLIALWDATPQKWAEAALRQSEAALADFFEQAPLGLLWVAPDGRILRVNRAQVAMLGLRQEDLFGRKLTELAGKPALVTQMLDRLARHQAVHHRLVQFRHRDGSLRHVLIDANGLWDQGKMVHSRWFVRDVTRRVELEKEILAIGERVQQRIGQDLHDDLCQQLTSIEFLARPLERQLSAHSPAEAARAREVARLTRQAIAHTRELAHGMCPVNLAPAGLTGALEGLAACARKLFHVDCRFRCDRPILLTDPTSQTHLYRIAQEAIGNAVKHGKATRIDIRLRETASKVVLGVQDNGVGLPRASDTQKGLGLRIMQYRAGVLGGALAVRKGLKGGTTVVCSIPRNTAA